MKSSAKKIELASVDDLFSTEEGRQDAKLEKIQEIPLSELHPFKNHPFKVKDDEAMMETADSIKQYGVLVPAIARPDPEGGYELVAGHRRHRASELAEKETMPVIVRDLDDDAATIIMVDSNLQRESLLPSERALVPAKVIEEKCKKYMKRGKATHRNNLLQDDDFSIVQTYQQEYRGLVQYYILAQNLSWFSKLYWYMETSLLKTLACKHRSSINKQKAKYKTTTTSTSGKTVPCLQVVVERPNKKPLVATWGGISLVHKRKAVIEDIPYKVYGGRTELVKRLLAEKCELCGSTENIEVHHIRKLADLKKKGQAEVPKWVQIMSARKRKTLVVCRECHVAIHNGNITKSS